MEQLAELKINSDKLYRYIAEELDDRERSPSSTRGLTRALIESYTEVV